ncbi:MAG: energy transducer TonB [Gemmatimonadales bacterium]
MFALIESGRAPRRGGEWTSRTLSLAIHTAIITAGVMATRQVAQSPDPKIFVDPNLIWTATPTPRSASAPCAGCQLPGRPFPTPFPVPVPDPTLDPATIPTSFTPGVSADPGAPPSITLAPGTRPMPGGLPLESRVVDEPPEMLSHPEPRYPEILRQAGIEGNVLVEAVIDTTGRVEAGSLRIISAAHPLFASEAEQVVLASRYRPGRTSGRAVRVRVRVPISFDIQR